MSESSSQKSVAILGISAFYHDSAASLLIDGKIIAAAQEERFTRIKHDAAFPQKAIEYCLREGNVDVSQITHVVFYDKPLLKFERLLDTYLYFSPKGLMSFLSSMPVWIKDKLFLKKMLRDKLAEMGKIEKRKVPEIFFTTHHQSHSASAFFASPFQKALVLCLDGVGEWATSSVWIGDGNKLEPVWEIDFPHSLGLLYSSFTYYTGFKVNSGEYKLMGLAPYGRPVYEKLIFDHLVDLKPDGSYRLNMKYFNYTSGLTMTNRRFNKLFGAPPRRPEDPVTQREMDLAKSIQVVLEKIILCLAKAIFEEHKIDNLCLAGGVALNCVANGNLLRDGPFKNIWVQPAAGDAGGSLGAALSIWYQYLGNPRSHINPDDMMNGSFLGIKYENHQVQEQLDSMGAKYEYLEDQKLLPLVAEYLSSGKVVGWVNGRMEYGPRALGSRSILGDPRNEEMQATMNLKIKFRESFRPFAPAIKYDQLTNWFKIDRPSPYMLFVAEIQDNKKEAGAGTESKNLTGMDLLKIKRSQIPAVTHVDYSARVQTVHPETNKRFYKLIDEFDKKTGCPILINTSFNVRGEPMVCSPEDAYRCFMQTDIDYLVIENYLLDRKGQENWQDKKRWQREFGLD